MIRLSLLPNILSSIRILLVVPIGYFLWNEMILHAILIMGFAAVTDLADGFLAREFRWKSKLGSWLDPVADKLLIATCVFILTLKGIIPLWFFLIVFIRDLGLTIGALTFFRSPMPIRIRPVITGRLATFFQILSIMTSIASYFYKPLLAIVDGFFWIAGFLTVISAVQYARAYRGIQKRMHNEIQISRQD